VPELRIELRAELRIELRAELRVDLRAELRVDLRGGYRFRGSLRGGAFLSGAYQDNRVLLGTH